jgi:hypothetical protein
MSKRQSTETGGIKKGDAEVQSREKVEVYRSEFKVTRKTVFKADKDSAQIIHVHKIVDFLYYQCYRDQRPELAAITRKRCKANLTANIESLTGGASMLKKEIAIIRVRVQEAKRKCQYDDLYGSDTSSGTADLVLQQLLQFSDQAS